MEILKRFRKLIILAVVIVVALVAVIKILPMISEMQTQSSPVIGISATCSKSFQSVGEIGLSDFTVYADRENGKSEKFSNTEDMTIDTSECMPVGDNFVVTISYDGEYGSFTCETEVYVERTPLVDIKCGYPVTDSVTATLYSNGELAFTGSGDVMVFETVPWKDLEVDTEIVAVSFAEGVEPTNMDYWFEDMESLAYCDPIPLSVKTMVRTFYGCTALTEAPDWSNDNNLLNITSCYEGCSSLETTSAIPPYVSRADQAFKDCVAITETPDMSRAMSLTSAYAMYEGCVKLNTVVMAPAVRDMSRMFADCINLKTMPSIPTTVTDLSYAFSGDISLETLTTIPKSVETLEGTFENCQLIHGTIEIDAECSDFSKMFSGAAVATQINITGTSLLLHAYANTADYGNVFVNGYKPDESLKTYKDVQNAEQEATQYEQTEEQT